MRFDETFPILLARWQNTELDDDCACANAVTVSACTAEPFNDDCACSGGRSEWNRQVLRAGENYQRCMQTLVQPVAPDAWMAFSPYAPLGPSVLNRAALQRLQQFSTPQPLVQSVDREFVQQGLLLPVDRPATFATAATQELTAWLHLSNACNLDCPYCYVRKDATAMSLPTGERALQRLFETALRHQFSSIKLKYAGGEPLLQRHLLHALHQRSVQLSQQTGLAVREVVLSNGTLWTAADVAWLVQNSIQLMLSLDGVDQVQDCLRPSRNGQSSFAALQKATDALLLPAGIYPQISITVTGRNAGSIAEVVAWALQRNLPISLNFYRTPLGADAHSELAFEEQQIIAGVLAAYRVVEERRPDFSLLDSLLDRCRGVGHTNTCGAGQSYIVVNHQGRLAQCQMLLDQPLLAADSEDWLEQVRHGPLQNIAVDQKLECSACLYRYRCTGGCPLESHRIFGRWDAKSPNCAIYQALLPEVLRLEALRLYRQASLH